MATLQSPGVAVRIIDETLTAGTGPGTIPLVFMATASNKTVPGNGSIAEGTLPENAGTLELITSQRELLQKYGVPFFRESDGTTVQGDEVNEYGLHAAYSYLGLANRAYVVRADIDTGQLLPSEEEPRGRPANGTYWHDFTETSFGLFVSNGNEIPGLAWDNVEVSTPSKSDLRPSGVPKDAFGDDGDVAVNVFVNNNPFYEKIDGSWYLIGTSDWLAEKETVALGTEENVVASASTVNLIINGDTVVIADQDSISDVVSAINAANIDDITADEVDNKLEIRNTAGGDITIASDGTALSDYGLNAQYNGIELVFASHTQIPNGETVGSFWFKTTNPNNGADWEIRRYDASVDSFQSVNAPLYADDSAANSGFGSARSVGSVYVQYDVSGSDPEATFTIKRWNGSQWEVLSYEASVTEPTSDPDEGTLWYNAALEADILVNTGDQWRGYRNVYPATDPNGPQITSAMPTAQSTGAPLADYDLWIRSDAVLEYPRIYRYLNGSWNLIDNTDQTTPFGVVFGDIRQDSGPLGPWIQGGTAATATATLEASNIFIKNPGAGYDDGTYTATVVGGSAVGSDETEAEVVVVNGQVFSIELTNAGEYSSLPSGGVEVEMSGIDGSPTTVAKFNVNWSVANINVTGGGSGYTTEPLVSIIGGGGIGAEALSEIDTGVVTDITVTAGGSGYSSIPSVLVNTPFGQPLSTNVADMAVSDWNDPVELDILNPQLFPQGLILFNTRRSTNTVKVWRPEFFDGVTTYTVGNFLSDSYELANPGARDAAITYLQNNPERWVNFSGNDLDGAGFFGRFAQRVCVTRALSEQIIGNQEVRSEFINFNLMATPGYLETFSDMITLNVDRGETAFIITDTPFDLSPSGTDLNNWANNAENVANSGRLGRTNLYDYAAMYYPGGALSTNVDGREIVVPSSTVALRTYGFNDSVAFVWTPPAGTRRGVINNASSVGYLDLVTRDYTPVTLNQGQRDVLYENKINPLAFIPGRGLLVYGDKTLTPNDESALSRINVARLVVYLRTVLPQVLQPFLFELNTEKTRAGAAEVVRGIMSDLLGKDAISDFLVVADSSNNPPEVIDRNELVVDVLVAPTRSVNFILVPVRLQRTGAVGS